MALGLTDPTVDLLTLVGTGEGRFFLVQAESPACGFGTLGYSSGGAERVNDDTAACPH